MIYLIKIAIRGECRIIGYATSIDDASAALKRFFYQENYNPDNSPRKNRLVNCDFSLNTCTSEPNGKITWLFSNINNWNNMPTNAWIIITLIPIDGIACFDLNGFDKYPKICSDLKSDI